MKNVISIVLISLLAGYILFPAAAPASEPAVFKIGFVNFREVFDKYKKTAEVNERLKSENERIQAEGQQLLEKYEQLKGEVKLLRQDSPEYGRKIEDIKVLEVKIESLQTNAERDMMNMLLTHTESIYLEIRDKIEGYGKTHGYSLILKVDDIDLESIHSKTLSSLNEKIQTRPVLFYDPQYDLTETIIGLLNE